jgi:hypothetical protein
MLAAFNRSSPNYWLVQEDNLDACLRAATVEFLEAKIRISRPRRTVWLPKQFKWYSEDFGTAQSSLHWMLPFLRSKKDDLQWLLEQGERIHVVYEYDWTSQLLFFRQRV